MIPQSLMLKLINFYPPFLGAGIRINADKDFRRIEVVMKLRFWNANYVRTQFGGSLYAMTDPFYMLMLIKNLGREYIVWDKAATIQFKRPGKGRVRAIFELTPEMIEKIKADADRDPKTEPVFQVKITDDDGNVVAEVDKTVYVKRKDKIRAKN